MRDIATIPAVLGALEENEDFRRHYYDLMFDLPGDVSEYADGKTWGELSKTEKLHYAEFVFDVIHGEPSWEAAEYAYREAIGFPVGAISYHPQY